MNFENIYLWVLCFAFCGENLVPRTGFVAKNAGMHVAVS